MALSLTVEHNAAPINLPISPSQSTFTRTFRDELIIVFGPGTIADLTVTK
jgi:hypothetical protein